MNIDKRKGVWAGYKKSGPVSRFLIWITVISIPLAIVICILQLYLGPSKGEQNKISQHIDSLSDRLEIVDRKDTVDAQIKAMPNPRVSIPVPALLKSLEDQLARLDRLIVLCQQDPANIKDLSVTLRLLVGNDEALLISLSRHFNLWPKLIMNSPWQEEYNLNDYLHMMAWAGQTSEGQKQLSNQQIINFVATQDGGIDQPWTVDVVYAALKDMGNQIFFNDVSLFVMDFLGRASTISAYGHEFLAEIEKRPNIVGK